MPTGAFHADFAWEGDHVRDLAAFLAPSPASFAQLSIKFTPKAENVQQQELLCENDLAVCNRECERLYGERQAEMEEPCKLAVASHFTDALCFPIGATVSERCRGTIGIADVRVGDELAAEGGEPCRVVALLHANPVAMALYLQIRHAAGELCVSPHHLVRVRRRAVPFRAAAGLGDTPGFAPPEDGWSWAAAQDVRPGDELVDGEGRSLAIEEMRRACLPGVFAPLTASGVLLVDGVLCSCYAPPAAWTVDHGACHTAMLPLRLLDALREVVERWSRPGRSKEPLLTVEALWLLPRGRDLSVHPYASGLLRAAGLARAALEHSGISPNSCLAARPARTSAPGVTVLEPSTCAGF